MDPSTIAAIATAAGSGAIGIVKISGPRAITIAGTLFHPARKGSTWTCSHRLCYGHVNDPASGRRIDDVLVGVMRGPSSYTGEDVVEINAHAGPAVMACILDLVLKGGARLAEPGEFTRRAFVNGRIDLTQAEAVIDIVEAKTVLQQRNAAAQLEGGLKTAVSQIRHVLVAVLAQIEAAIDFPEDVAFDDPEAIGRHLSDGVLAPALALCDSYDQGRIVRDGVRLALVGRPNVGKSSLMNRLLATERVIVTPYPGTTRDIIEETIQVNGVTIAVADTAGLHDSADPLETLGMDRTRAHIRRCDMILVVVQAVGDHAADEALVGQLQGKPLIVVINKIDLADEQVLAKTSACWHRYPRARVSALTGVGIEQLRAMIGKTCLGQGLTDPDRVIPALRHKQALAKVVQHTRAAVTGLRQDMPAEILSLEVHAALRAADQVLGIEVTPEVLDAIFQRFCIGK